MEVLISEHWFTQGEIFDNGYILGKLYYRDIIERNGIRFEETVKMAEDLLFLLDYISFLPMNFPIEKAPGCCYFYVRDITGLSYARNTAEHDLKVFELLLKRVNRISHVHKQEITPMVMRKIVPPLFQSLKSTAITKQKWNKKLKKIRTLKLTYGNYIPFFVPENRLDKVLKKMLQISPFFFMIIGGTYMKLKVR